MPGGFGRMLVMGASAGITLLLALRVRRMVMPHAVDECCHDNDPSHHVNWASANATPAPREADASSGSGSAGRWRSRLQLVDTIFLEVAAFLIAIAAAVAIARGVPGGCAVAIGLVACEAVLSFLLGACCAASRTSTDEQDATQATVLDASASPPATPSLWIRPDMTGVWVKVPRLSDPMDAACNAMHLNGLVRLAVRLVRGIEINITPPADGGGAGTFELAVFSVFPWFKVRERYDLNGAVSRWNRRDLRKGTHQGFIQVLPSGRVQLHLKWGEPHGGTGWDEFVMMGPNELHVISKLQTTQASTSNDGTVTFKTVYMRKQQ